MLRGFLGYAIPLVSSYTDIHFAYLVFTIINCTVLVLSGLMISTW